MNELLLFAAHNSVVALVLALFVHALTRVWRNPPLAHALWLLVLVKLVVPPVLYVDGSTVWPPSSMLSVSDRPRLADPPAEGHQGMIDQTQTLGSASVTSAKPYELDADVRWFWHRARPVLLVLWLAGAVGCAVVTATRIVRFERLLRDTLPAPERLQRLATEIAGSLGVRRMPRVRYVDCVDVPLLWCAGGHPTIALPMRLFSQLDDQQAALILAHEMAHLRRRDHWVRAVELLVSIVYWWNPLVWVLRRRIHQTEDLCCDAWVRYVFPDCTKRYAEVVLQTAESISRRRQIGARLLPASPFLHSLSLKARIEMILESRFAPRASKRSLLVVALLAILVLPSFVRITGTVAAANEKTPATSDSKPDVPTTSAFPYVLKYEQGVTRFLDGDKITITEIRGTAETFAPGNIYWIKGTYALASHDRASLAAYITAMDAENGRSRSYNVQSTVVDRGDGTFTLFLPMLHRGWPHVSYYPADGGEGFGGNYFGTGESVLKRWWGEKETD